MSEFLNKLIVINPVTKQASEKVDRYGNEWVVHTVKETMLASPKLGTWFFMQSNSTGNFCWFYHKDFEVLVGTDHDVVEMKTVPYEPKRITKLPRKKAKRNASPKAKAAVKEANAFEFKSQSDPGHSWIAVKRDVIDGLNLSNKIEGFSFQSGSGKTIYLEEDTDGKKVIEALEKKGKSVKVIEGKHFDKTCPIRKYPAYAV